MFHRSERLFLRPAFPEDARELYLRICDAAVVAMLSRAPWPYHLADAEQACTQPADSQVPSFLITLPGGKGAPIVGGIGFKHEGDDIELGYWVARDHWGNGYASEAGAAALEIARALGRRRVLAGHYIDNPASGRVLRKLGFRETGEIRPTFCRARGGEMVLARRYAVELAQADAEAAAQGDRMRAA